MRAVEFLTESVQEVTLNDLYHDNYPDRDELIWNFVGKNDFNIPFTVRKINPIDLDELIIDNYGVDDVQDLFKKMQPEQERIISDYQNDPTLSQKIIVLSGRRILDGHHRALAAVLANKPIKYIDVSEEQQDLDEDPIPDTPGINVRSDNDATPIISFMTTYNEKIDENSEQLKFTVKKSNNTFSVQLLSDNNVIGSYQYDNRTNRHIAEVLPKYKGKGYGKLLLLKALDTANKLGFDFIEDESRTSEYDNMLDSLQNSGYVVSDDGQLYLTQNGLDYLNNKVNFLKYK